MKIRHLFWGLFFVTIGILILLRNVGSLNFDLSYIWKFWPVVFILLGLSYFTTNSVVKGFLSAISAIIIAAALFAFFNSIFWFVNDKVFFNDGDGVYINSKSDTSNYYETYDPSISKAEFDLDAGAGSFNIKDTTSELFSAYTTGHKNYYRLERETNDGKTTVKLLMKKRSFTFFDGKNDNEAEIKLNPSPVWDLDFNGGAAVMDFDLTPFKTENINVKMGAAKIKIKLGDKNKLTTLNLKAGASSIEILVPESSGCEIVSKAALSEKQFNGFNKVSHDTYQTDNFNQAKNKIYLNLNAGVSSIHVDRYTGSGW
ncbi:MAG: LiaF transmembrane domain-containing protein [Ignavibacteriaceae bacterium]